MYSECLLGLVSGIPHSSSIGMRGVRPNINSYGEYPVDSWQLVFYAKTTGSIHKSRSSLCCEANAASISCRVLFWRSTWPSHCGPVVRVFAMPIKSHISCNRLLSKICTLVGVEYNWRSETTKYFIDQNIWYSGSFLIFSRKCFAPFTKVINGD